MLDKHAHKHYQQDTGGPRKGKIQRFKKEERSQERLEDS